MSILLMLWLTNWLSWILEIVGNTKLIYPVLCLTAGWGTAGRVSSTLAVRQRVRHVSFLSNSLTCFRTTLISLEVLIGKKKKRKAITFIQTIFVIITLCYRIMAPLIAEYDRHMDEMTEKLQKYQVEKP